MALSFRGVPTLLDLFDLVTVISLAERQDRLQQMRRQMQRIGSGFPAHVQLFPAIRPETAAGFPTRGAHGCFLSHLGCIELALRNGADSLLILEDDVVFPDYYSTGQLVAARRLEQSPWDFFYGGGVAEWLEPYAPEAKMPCDGMRPIPADIAIREAHFVAINGHCLADLHDYLSGMLRRPEGHPDGGPMDVDGAYSWFRKSRGSRTLMADPALAFQGSFGSDIRPPWHDRMPLVRNLAWLYRSARNRLGGS